MKIYIFRHAQKAMDFSGNPDLTVEGHAQAAKLADRVQREELPQPTALWVSPKIRTHSTFRPLSQQLKLALQERQELLEQTSDETLSEFRARIEKLLAQAAKEHGTVFICSHYDWVLEAMAVIPSDTDLTAGEFTHWSPCQYTGFEVEDGFFKFIELKRISL